MNSDILTTKVFLLFLTLPARKFLDISQINLSLYLLKNASMPRSFPGYRKS